MPVACDAQSLVTAAQCYECQIPPGMSPAITTYLLASINNSLSGGSMDPTVLANAAKCFRCADGDQAAIQTYLLCQIVTALGG